MLPFDSGVCVEIDPNLRFSTVLPPPPPKGTERRVLSSDLKTVKIWNRDNGTVVTNVETPADINDVCVAHDARCVRCVCVCVGQMGTLLAKVSVCVCCDGQRE